MTEESVKWGVINSNFEGSYVFSIWDTEDQAKEELERYLNSIDEVYSKRGWKYKHNRDTYHVEPIPYMTQTSYG
jgi:ArsR family metal-binding transcriptional regulator